MYFTIWSEKTEGQGKDAFPTVIFKNNYTQGLIAVYEGIDQENAYSYAFAENSLQNQSYSGAYLASRFAKKVTEGFFEYGELDENFAENLQYSLQDDFKGYLYALEPEFSNFAVTIPRLSTSIAGMYFAQMQPEEFFVITFWAGNARCYFLTARGLLQLNPSENSTNHYPFVNADREFQLQSYKSIWREPVIFLVVTEGCWKDSSSELHFEYQLLQSLMQANSFATWKEMLQTLLKKEQPKDMSLCLVAQNFDQNFTAIKVHYFARLQMLREEYVQPLESLEKSIEILEREKIYLTEKITQLHQEKQKIEQTFSKQFQDLSNPLLPVEE